MGCTFKFLHDKNTTHIIQKLPLSISNFHNQNWWFPVAKLIALAG